MNEEMNARENEASNLIDQMEDQWDEALAKSAEKYIQAGGVSCLYCNSTDLEGQSVDIEDGSAFQKVVCRDCGQGWVDIYKLVWVVP
jgi:hypothetical protein